VKIITYTTTDPDAPPNMRAAAAMVPAGPGTHWLATGSTEEAARAKLEAMLPKERAPRTKAPTAAPVGDVI
jgi:hypothetical protein